MLIFPPPPHHRRKGRKRRTAAVAPPPPVVPALVVSTTFGPNGTGGYATLTFDQPVPLAAGSPTPDGAITFSAGYLANSVSQVDDHTLRFELTTGMYGGAPWNVNGQPAWIDAPVAWPQAGTF